MAEERQDLSNGHPREFRDVEGESTIPEIGDTCFIYEMFQTSSVPLASQ